MELVLASRLGRPADPAALGLVPPLRIQALLTEHPGARLVLLAAPSGFGKTAALRHLAGQRQALGQPVIWYRLCSADADPLGLLERLLDAVAAAIPPLGLERRLLLGAGDAPLAIEQLLDALASLPTPPLLVLDDFHHLQDREVLASLGRLLQRTPAGFTLALGSRTLPALRLATLRAKGLLLEVGVEALQLSEAETAAWLRRRGVAVGAETLAKLQARSDGWPVLVEALAERLSPAADARLLDDPALGGELLRSAFEALPMPLQDRLLALGIASRLSAGLVQALTGEEDGQAFLDSLEARQLFIRPLDPERRWYRLLQPFAAFLRQRLEADDPPRLRRLHAAASRWCASQGLAELAIEHAGLADDPQALAALLDGCALELTSRGQLGRILRWRQRIPDAIAARFPLLLLADAWSGARVTAPDEARRRLDGLLQRWADAPDAPAYGAALAVKSALALQRDDLPGCVALARWIELRLGQQAPFLEGLILSHAALALTLLGQPRQARRLLGLAQQRAHFLDGRQLGMQIANVEVQLALEQGELRQAQARLAQLQAQSGALEWRSSAFALPVISECLVAYQQARFAGLETRLCRALAQLDPVSPLALRAAGLLTLARLRRVQRRGADAQSAIDELHRLAQQNQSSRFTAAAVAEELAGLLLGPAGDRLRRAQQRYDGVDWEHLAADYRARRFNPVLWVRQLSRIRLLQARGEDAESLRGIAQARQLLQSDWQAPLNARLDLLESLAQQRLGYRERAHGLLTQTLIGAEREGVRSLFIEEGEAVRQLLRQLQVAERQPALQGFLRELLSLWPGASPDGVQQAQEGLTAREREVLQLAGAGLPNEAIGERLGLALGTVKWHLHNVYEKLAVKNRTQALRRAGERGWLA